MRPRHRRIPDGVEPAATLTKYAYSGGNRRQMPAGGIIENLPVAGHQSCIHDPRRRYDHPVDRVAMECFRKAACLDGDFRKHGFNR